jgi:hypothetical protein
MASLSIEHSERSMNNEKIYSRSLSLLEGFREAPRQWMDSYVTFNEIPSSSRSFLDLAYWLSVGYRPLTDIPKSAWTDRLIVFSFVQRQDGLDLILPGDTARYPRILVYALWRSSLNFRFVPCVFITHALIETIILSNSRHNPLEFFENSPSFEYLFTDKILNLSVSNSVGCLRLFHKRGYLHKIRDESIEAGLRKSLAGFAFVFRLGKRAIVTKMMKEGFWLDDSVFLHSDVMTPKFGKNPGNVDEVLALWDDARKNWNPSTLYVFEGFFVAKIESFTEQESVERLAQTEQGRDFLNRYYDHDKIVRCAANSSLVRGFLLEKQIGL